MDEELSADNMSENIDFETLFNADPATEEGSATTETEPIDNSADADANREITPEADETVDFESLFTGDPGETDEEDIEDTNSKDNQEQGDTSPDEQNNPPKASVYSTLANAFKEKGIFSALDDSSIKKIQKEEDFMAAIQEQIKAGLDEKQQNIDAALNSGIEPDVITTYTNNISYLESITEEKLSNEEEGGEKIRKNIIYQDYINKGFDRERALREVDKSFKAGTDIEDAKDSLIDATTFYKNSYSKLIAEAKAKEEAFSKQRDDESIAIKKSILEDTKIYNDLQVDKITRNKVYDNISKPVYTDKESGKVLTAIQKYQKDNSVDFIKNVGLIYTLTDGFKNMEGLVGKRIKQGVKNGMSALENTLKNTMLNSKGNIELVSSETKDPESQINSSWSLDV